MRVIVVSRGIPSDRFPMNGIFEWDQARALRAAGINVTFIVLDLRSIRRKRKFVTHSYNKDGINIVYGSLALGNIAAPIFFSLSNHKLRKLLKIAIDKFGKPNIIHGHFTDIGAITAHEAKRLGIPCIVTEHSSSLNLDILSPRTTYFAKRAYSNATTIISVSKRLRKRLKQHFGIDSTVVPNVVDVESIKFSHKTHTTKNKVHFVATGSLLQLKGHDLLIASFANLPRDTAELIIIGEGPERKNLEIQINSLHLEDNVKLVGFKNRNEISEIYSKADCFVLASRRETFGVVYIEAMLAGLPVIATRCGGPEDFVHENNGLLIETESVEELSKALKKMIDTSNNYSPELIHQTALNSFSPSSISQQLIAVYNKTI
ncbi:MAG: glycosyltransferase [Muribaculaceae bacterium]|nr:glycosyltransferase [Muribaculaceae bacterium]